MDRTNPKDAQPALRGLKNLDPERTRLRLMPDRAPPRRNYRMDAVRNIAEGELYLNVVVDNQ